MVFPSVNRVTYNRTVLRHIHLVHTPLGLTPLVHMALPVQHIYEDSIPLQRFEPISITIAGEIDEDTTEHVTKELTQAMQTGQTFVVVYITSVGGDVIQALVIYETLLHANIEVHTVALGEVSSAAVILLLAGKNRFMSPLARVMLHEVSADFGASHSISALQIATSDVQATQDIVSQILVSRAPTTQMRSILRRCRRGDVYLSAEESQSCGIITHIGIPQVEVNYHAFMTLILTDPQRARKRPRSKGLLLTPNKPRPTSED
jgi:ATP-dependent Clp protease, protease subunit